MTSDLEAILDNIELAYAKLAEARQTMFEAELDCLRAHHWITPTQAARMMGCDPRTVGRMIDRGELTARTLLGRRRVLLPDVLRMMIPSYVEVKKDGQSA